MKLVTWRMEKSQQPSNSQKILEKSTKGVTFLMFSQLFTKIISFVLNNLLIRYLSPRIFGITAFLEFLLSTVLFFSREAIRLSTLRIKAPAAEDSGKQHDDELDDSNSSVLQSVVNFAYIPLCIGFPLSLVLIAWQYSNLNEYFIALPFFKQSIAMIWLSIMMELFSEPFFIVNQFMLNYKVRSQIESIAVTIACAVNFIVVYLYENKINGSGPALHDDLKQEGIAILAFSIGKLAYSSALLLCYYYDYLKNFAPKNQFSIKLSKIHLSQRTQPYYFQNDIMQHFKKVYFQLCFKHLLTEGDKLIINSLCTVEEQGIYSLLSNYGSLLTRLLFAPIEESLRLFLTRLLSVMSNKNLRMSMEVLINLTKFYLYLSLVIIIFGPINSSFLLQFLIGSKWSSTSVLESIRVYCFYLPFLSMNGIFEAFFQSVATGDQILKHSYLMMVFSGVFLGNCWILIDYFQLSLDGLIISNIINMGLRIIYCVWFISGFYKELFAESSKNTSFLFNFRNLQAVFVVSCIIGGLDWWFIGYVKNFRDLLINIFLASMLLSIIIYKEKKLILGFIRRSGPVVGKEV